MSVNVVESYSAKGDSIGDGAGEVVRVDGRAELHVVLNRNGGKVDTLEWLLLGKSVELRR